MSRTGSCACGAVRYRVDGPVRDVIVCHCDACTEAAGGPFAASSARRDDLVVEDPDALRWVEALVSAFDASRGFCRACGAYVFWDAPGLRTVSFAASTLDDSPELRVAAHIWVPEGERDALTAAGVTVTGEGLGGDVRVPWHDAPG